MAIPAEQQYDTRAALDVLRQITVRTTAAGIDTSERVTQTLTELESLVEAQELAVQGLREFAPTSPENGALLDRLADGLAQQTATPDEVLDYLHRISEGTDKPLKKLENAVRWRFSKRADQALRQLGDTIALDLLGPWVSKLAADLDPHAVIITENGPVVTDKSHYKVQGAFTEAERIVADMTLAWKFAAALRRNGVLTGDDTIDQRHFQWTRIDKLHDIDGQHRQPFWTCKSLLNSAGPRVATTADVRTQLVASI